MIHAHQRVRISAPNLPAPLHGTVSELLPALDIEAIEPYTTIETHQLLRQLDADLVANITHHLTGHEYGFTIAHQRDAADNTWLTITGTPLVITPEES